MSKKKNAIPSYTKETKEARYERVSNGISFRPAIYKDKSKYNRKEKHKRKMKDDDA